MKPQPTFLGTVYADYDQFAAMMGSQRDIDQPATKFDKEEEFSSREEALNWATEQVVLLTDLDCRDELDEDYSVRVFEITVRGKRTEIFHETSTNFFGHCQR